MSILGSDKGAKFNEDKTHRYFLWRIWDESLPLVMFVGLNPSTADATKDDPTVRRCKKFAKDNGYGGMYMMNLFSVVSSNPKILLEGNTITDGYDDELKRVAAKCEKVIFCWGGFSEAKQRQMQVIEMFPDAFCFGHNADHTPKHPLYLKSTTELKPYNAAP